ncbi:unnamed protein product [Vitrella brassicaformis CCMP3155]|uniref:Leucine-rich repeat-containing N-terminal plant-type domain-containing protein n=1 Tax=Vitrella brassicaformis (strain CCMP3155) TaxID=1169540 RepID=A0A0G4F6T2_VITBC|nr:unnamed protein product [Vitrella brassicaformis CCMP3155]|eukprot:CEM08132.1 unnamed protein product [Vitrella brassicaformis CCMP3155]
MVILPSVVFISLFFSLVARAPVRTSWSASPPLPPGWRDPRRLKLLRRFAAFFVDDRYFFPESDDGLWLQADEGLNRGDNILPYTEMEELERCDSCQEDAAALFEWSHESGLVDDDSIFTFETNLCVVPFITCVRLTEVLADGGPREGYMVVLTPDDNFMALSDVPQILWRRGQKPLVFSPSFYRLRHMACFLAHNMPMQGSLGDDIAKLTSLRVIYMLGAENSTTMDKLEGPLPATIGELPYLKGLYMILMPSMSGVIPPSLFSLSRLEALQLSNTGLSVSIPGYIGRFQRLRVLVINSNNRWEQGFPVSVMSCRNLTRLSLRGHALVGPLPDNLGALSRLDWLDLSDNKLSGELP